LVQRVSLSWFHVPSRRFLGRTFVTQPVPVCFSLTEDYSIKNLQFDEMIYLKTNVSRSTAVLRDELQCISQLSCPLHCLIAFDVVCSIRSTFRLLLYTASPDLRSITEAVCLGV
jgi:hypothetical protein